MQREIKFRAFDKEAKTMHQVSVIDFEDKYVLYARNNFYKDKPFYMEKSFDEIELMQFTGLTDKNGGEVYEGDILAPVSKEFFYYVGFENGMFCIYNNLGRWATMERGIEIYKELNVDFEIIGNIHKNPELLK